MLKKQPADDLFENSSMSFGEHLDELRKALIKAFIWLGLGTIGGLFLAEDIVTYFQNPLIGAIKGFYIVQAKAQFKEANGIEPSERLAALITEKELLPEVVFVDPLRLADAVIPLPGEAGTSPTAVPSQGSAKNAPDPQLASPTDEVANGPAVKAGVASIDQNPWQGMDAEKLERLRPLIFWKSIPNKLISLNATEGFMIWLKAGLVAGVVLGSPGIFWHIWQFFAAGLYPHERRYVYWYLPLSLLLFFAGVALAFFVVFELVLGFLMNYTSGLNVEFTPRLNDYMSFALFLPLGFGIAFQLPLVMLGLHRFGLVTADTFVKQWRIAVLAIAFLSMVLTPAEIYSMIGLFIPLTCLYFFGIALCKYMPQGAGVGARVKIPTTNATSRPRI